jgi:hypothetical protein
MAKANVETYNEDGQWKSRRQGSSRAFSTGGTKAEQQAKGRDAVKRDGVEHVIKKLDGTIGEKNSYGNDPNPSALATCRERHAERSKVAGQDRGRSGSIAGEHFSMATEWDAAITRSWVDAVLLGRRPLALRPRRGPSPPGLQGRPLGCWVDLAVVVLEEGVHRWDIPSHPVIRKPAVMPIP